MQYAQKRSIHIVILAILIVFICASARAAAVTISSPAGLTLSQIKMTGDEFIAITNNTGSSINDLSAYWLTAYNNVNPLAAGVSSSSQQLPAAGLAAGHVLLLSANPMQTCGAQVAGKLSLSLTDAGGLLQITRAVQGSSGAVMHEAHDAVSWSSGQQGLIRSVPAASKSPYAVFFRYFDGGSHVWQMATIDTANTCQLNLVVAGASESSFAVTPLTLAATSPPATVIGDVSGLAQLPTMPLGNIGLRAPQMSELLPNPAGTGNDKTDEFIELYNPNDKPFELTGFILQVGATKKYDYVFPAGTILAPLSFKAFYASETKLSLSNTSGHASLFDPFGTHLVSSAAYNNAKDGVSWAIASNQWQWTTKSTPNEANIISAPVAKSKSKTKVKTAQATLGSAKNANTMGSAAASGTAQAQDQNTVIHPWMLALVALGAILYGAYEYRRDITNLCYKLGAKLKIGSFYRKSSSRR